MLQIPDRYAGTCSIGLYLFYFIGNYVPYEIKPSGGCALRAKEIWPLKRPRFGARVRRAGLFVHYIGNYVPYVTKPSGGMRTTR